MEEAALASDAETRNINNNNSDKALYDDVVNNIQDELRRDGKSLKLKTSFGTYGIRDSQHLDDVSICAASTEASTDESYTDGIMRTNTYFDCTNTLEDDSALNEIMVGGTTYTRPRNSVSVKHLSKIWKMSDKAAGKTINITTQQRVRTQESTLEHNQISNNVMLGHNWLDSHFSWAHFMKLRKRV